MAMGRRMRPESTIALTADRLRPNPVVSSFSTRMGTGSSNLMITVSGAGSSRSGSQDGMLVSSSHVPLKGIEWLVINLELTSLKPLAQVGLDPEALGRATSHGSLVEHPV